MSVFTSIDDYRHWSVKEKLLFFDKKSVEKLSELDEKKVEKFLREIILDQKENSYIKKKALEIYINCVMLKKIKKRFALRLLLDEWSLSKDSFMEVSRIKKLLLFYTNESDESKDIEELFNTLIENDDDEVKSESLFQLGLLNLFKANILKDNEHYLRCLKVSLECFEKAGVCIENRVDAIFFSKVVSILIGAIENNTRDFSQEFYKIRELLWHQRVFSFNGEVSPIQVGVYRTIYSFKKIKIAEPSDWLDYRKEFNELCYYFYQLKNEEIVNDLFGSEIINNISDNLIRRSIEPLFAINFNAEMCKIEKILNEVEKDTEVFKFLVYLKTLATEPNIKESAMKDLILQTLFNQFPHIDRRRIKRNLDRIKEHSISEIMNVYESLMEYSDENLLSTLISACINLQGNQLYRGATENERNTFLVSSLDMAGFFSKDQTLWGKSNQGKTSGEVDIFIKQKDGKPFSIVEALNLNSLKKDYLNLHLNKIFKYDTTGLKYNYIIVYYTAKDFSAFWKRYLSYVSQYSYLHPLKSIEEVEGFDFANIRLVKSAHLRNDKGVFLYHIVIDLG